MVCVGTGSGAKNTRSWKKCGVLRHFAGDSRTIFNAREIPPPASNNPAPSLCSVSGMYPLGHLLVD
jgi:hypothetical protein